MPIHSRPWSALTLLVACALSAASGCSSDRPPSLPRTTVYERFAPRVELVELALSDGPKAKKVRALYIEMEELFDALARDAAQELVPLAKPENPLTDEAIRGFFAHIRDKEQVAWKRYIEIQMELRRTLTPAEFARLDKVR